MKVAIVGTGYIAGRHAEALTAMEDIEIVGHVDVVPEAAGRAAEKWGGRSYDSADALLEHEQVDAVWLCVPPFAHGDLERTFIRHKIAMYIEKPLGTDVGEPVRLAHEISESNLVVNVGYYWRCIEVMPKLRSMLADTPPRLVRIAYHGPTAPGAWWRQQSKSGGQVIEQATHLVDTALWLLGNAEVISADSEHHDRIDFPEMDIATSTAALLRFDGGLPASFTATCILGSFVDTTIEFLCDGRKISLSLKELTVDTVDGRIVESTGPDPLVLADIAFITAVQLKDASAVPCSYDQALATQQLCYDITVKSKRSS